MTEPPDMKKMIALAGHVRRNLRLLAKVGLDAAAEELFGKQFEQRMAIVRERSAGKADPFGFDPETAKYAFMASVFWYRYYCRAEVHGIDRVPEGRVLLVSNHSGQLPIDAAMVASAMFFDADPPRVVRAMFEKWAQTLPWVSTLFSRWGHVVGVPENAQRLLEMGEPLIVFPEGAKGAAKPFSKRYQLAEFGLGFMRLALQTRTPIQPIAIIGAEEQYVNIGNSSTLARVLHMPVFPIIPQLLFPGGQFPLPVKYRMHFGEPIVVHGDPDDEDAVIAEKVATVRARIQDMVNEGLRARKHVFW